MSADDLKGRAGEEAAATAEALRTSPLHGFQGDRAPLPARLKLPASLTVAVSREAGSRGSSIGSRAGQKLGWQVYNQELLEYIAQEGVFRQDIVNNLSAGRGHLGGRAPAGTAAGTEPEPAPLADQPGADRPGLGAQGDAVLIGRGAGCILPRSSTLHVRLVAPLPDRIAYMSQWLRLTMEEAAEQVRVRDHRRAEFINTHFHRQPDDCYQYDLLLNTSLLGEELCAELIAQAARAKLAAYQGKPR